MKYTNYKTVAELTKGVDIAEAKTVSARNAVQNVAVGMLKHVAKHGDYSAISSLVARLVDVSSDAKYLVDWFTEFGGFTQTEGEQGFTGFQGKQFIIDSLEKAKVTMYWSYKATSPYKGFDLEEALAALISKAGKASKKAATDDSVSDLVHVDPDVLQALIAIKAGMSATVQ